ncbi:MAG: hypothetical protein LBN02_00945, partial [Oscillospiraceae bacterium]|nr:hypothetical protein [Oscillospiraceae bacterium]
MTISLTEKTRRFAVVLIVLLLAVTACAGQGGQVEEPSPSAATEVEPTVPSVEPTVPPDLVLRKQINENLPEFEVAVTISSREIADLIWDFPYSADITINSLNELYYQTITDILTDMNIAVDERGIVFDDYNFDGYLDLCVWMHTGGTSLNMPHYYWLWDSTANTYVENALLEELSSGATLYADAESGRVSASVRLGGYGGHIDYYEWYRDELVCVKTYEMLMSTVYNDSGEEIGTDTRYTTTELINGEWVITSDEHEYTPYPRDGVTYTQMYRRQIKENIPEFTFEVVYTVTESDVYSPSFNTVISVFGADGLLLQKFSDLEQYNYYSYSYPELRFDDWNFDGYLDLSIFRASGGSMRNEPCYYRLWDSAAGRFVENGILEELSDTSNLYVDKERGMVASSGRIDSYFSTTSYYKWE